MKQLIVTILTFVIILRAHCQSDSTHRWSLHGYISSMQSVMFDSINKNWTMDNYVTNRLNFKWYTTSYLSAVAEMRNRIVFGETIKNNPQTYASSFEHDYGWMNLNHNIATGNSYLVNLNVDRLYVAYQQDKLNITLGRQRINWGQTLVWNPNDIFNAYSFLDFDYIERPGSDALRLQYYTSETTVMEMAIKVNNVNQITAAGLYRFNTSGYDIQLLGGVFNSEDYVAGAGFSGAINSIALRGEASY